jgi:hypothetical protein
MNIVFDLDECLISTRMAHEEAYRSLGLVPSGLSKHLPAKFWMKDPVLYERKHDIFPQYLRRYGKILPTINFFLAVHATATILTGTSRRSVDALVEWLPTLRGVPINCAMGPDEKIDWLNNNEPGVYFDDWTDFVARVRKDTKWQAIDVSGF